MPKKKWIINAIRVSNNESGARSNSYSGKPGGLEGMYILLVIKRFPDANDAYESQSELIKP